MPKPKPKPQARGVAEGLRMARHARKFAMIEVADKLGWSQSTVSRIETGKRAATPEEVAALLAVYGVTGDRRDALVEMVRDADRSHWVETRYADVPEQAKTLSKYESEAVRLVYVGIILVPGLLQTPSYTRSLMNAGGVPASDIEARVNLRADRQQVLFREDSPTLVAFLDEAALRRRIGGSRVMADQLHHLIDLSARSNIEIRVVPFDIGGHPGINGAYFMVEFDNARPVVHLEHKRSGLFLHESKDVDPYVEATATMNAVALDAMQSWRMLEAIAADYE